MNLSSDKEFLIFKNDKGYTTTIGKKNSDGSYDNAYIGIQFNKDVQLENRTKIKIKNAWLSFYKIVKELKGETQTTTVFFIRCSDFEIVEEAEKEVANSGKKEEKNPFEEFGDNIKTEFDVGEQIQITDDDLPF